MKPMAWFAVLGIGLVLGGLYVALRPVPEPAAPAPMAAAPGAPAVAEFEFEIAAGEVRGPVALSVREGDRVALHVRSDVADELHVHGYDLSAPLPAGERVTLRFVATRAGRFDIELHHAHRELRALEVQPR